MKRGEIMRSTPNKRPLISPEKAKEILRDGTVHGKPITQKQRGYFGARAGSINKK